MSESTPFFSVVIPAYNRPHSLRLALRSVVSQTFKDFECLVIDDGSKDAESIKREVDALNDPRFTYHRQSNGGACKARNYGIRLARGGYIALLDSDDQFLQNKLAQYHDSIQTSEHSGQLFIYSQLIVDRGQSKTWIKPARGLRDCERMDEYLMCTHGWAQTSTQVLSSKLAKSVLFNEALPSSQDTDFAIRCWDAKATVVFIDRPLTIMNDVYDPERVSKQSNYLKLKQWVDSNKGNLLSNKAYWGYVGWEIARIASYTNRKEGYKYYFKALLFFPYSLKMAILIFAQVCIPQAIYQKFATTVVRFFGLATND